MENVVMMVRDKGGRFKNLELDSRQEFSKHLNVEAFRSYNELGFFQRLFKPRQSAEKAADSLMMKFEHYFDKRIQENRNR